MLLLGPVLHCAGRGPWNFGGFRNIFLPKIGENQKSLNFWARGPFTVSHGKSDPGYCITFIKRLDENLRKQLLGQKLPNFMGYTFTLVEKIELMGLEPPGRQYYC